MMKKRSFILFVLSILIFGGVGVFHINRVSADCSSVTEGKTKAQLALDLAACDAEIAKWTQILNNTKQESASYQRDISYLTAKINAAQSNIKAKNIAISNLTKNIAEKETKIQTLNGRLATGQKSIAQIIRRTAELDATSLPEIVLSNKDLSEFLVDMDTYASTEEALEELFNQIRGTRTQTEAEKAALAKQKQAEADAKAAIEAAKKEVEVSQSQKKSLLAESQSKEKNYSQVLADRQAKANQIRAALFQLRDTGAIQFGTALQYAQNASAKTGVRPALILAILQQESNLGSNVGSCVITDLSSGATKNVNTGRIYSNGIHPTRDLPMLQKLLPDVGRDPLTTKVSCPLSIGYGGAMGPAQFIPSTWNLMKSQIAGATGKSVPDPWNPSDAIMALALLLKNNGAGAGTYSAERNAACRYYGGGSGCTSTTSSYGNQVMNRASTIQTTMIDPLQGL